MEMIHYWEEGWYVSVCVVLCALLIGGCATTTTVMLPVDADMPITAVAPNADLPEAIMRIPMLVGLVDADEPMMDEMAGPMVTEMAVASDLGASVGDDIPLSAKSSPVDSTSVGASTVATVIPQYEAIRQSLAAATALPSAVVDAVADVDVDAVVDVDVGAGAEPPIADDMDEQSAAQALASATSPLNDPLAGALALLSQGFVSQGLRELEALDLTPPADPKLISAVAAYAAADQRPLLAIRLYQKNVGAVEPFNREALLELIDLTIERGEFDSARRFALQALQLGYTPSGTALIALASRALQAESYDEVARLLDLFAASAPHPELRDAYLWMQGQLLEQDKERRDIVEAILNYEQIVNFYPLSTYWEPARVRTQYLRRHFIDLR